MQARFSTGGLYNNEHRQISPGTRLSPYYGGQQNDWTPGFVSEVYQTPRNTSMPEYNGVMHAGLITGPPAWGGAARDDKIYYMDSGNFRPSEECGPQSNRGRNTGFCTDDFDCMGGENPPLETDRPFAQKEERFACDELSGGSNGTGVGTLVESFGAANNYLHELTLKLFNPRVVPNRILYGIVFFDVKEAMRVNRLKLKGMGKITKQIKKKKEPTKSEFPTSTFTKEVVTGGMTAGTRNQKSYNADTKDFDGSDVYQRLNLPDNLPEGNERLKPFSGPIALTPGTHAIPFAVRIPAKTNPTITFTRKSKKYGNAEVQLLYTVFAEVEMSANPSGGNATVSSEKVDVQIVSCGGLPPVAESRYFPAAIHMLTLPYKSADGMLVIEKTHLQSPDTIRVYVYSTKSKAIHSGYFEVFQLTNLPELGMTANAEFKDEGDEPGVKLIGTSNRASMKKDFRKAFASKVGEKFQPSMENYGRNPVNSNLDDRTKMPESNRKAGCVMELTLPENLDQNIDVGDTRIQYLLRVYLNVKSQNKSEKVVQPITISEMLLPNYKMQYINFEE
uniref:Uncharacterized protein n=2 Tax=Schistocephalus solidus TaxID=70667 RepID=A0A0X3PZS2_SCHSO